MTDGLGGGGIARSRLNRGTPSIQTAPVVRDYGTLSANATLYLSTADAHLIVLGGSITLTLDKATVPDRTKVRVFLTQDGTGSRVVTWSGVTWLSGSAPTLTTTASALDVLEFTFYSNGTSSTWYGRAIYTKTVAFPGNVTIAGTLNVVGNFSVNTNKFTVTASSGNTNVAGTLNSAGDFSVATNKFTVTASSGDAVLAGTLTSAKLGAVFQATATTTGIKYFEMGTTGGLCAWLIASSTGGTPSGASAYATVLYSENATPLELGTNGVVRLSISSAGAFDFKSSPVTFGSTISAAGLPTSAGASGTLYVDASGFVKRA